MISIEPEKKDFVTIMVEGEPWRVIHKKRFRPELVQIKAFTSKKALEEGFAVLEKSVAMRYVQNLLSLKAYFSQEVKEKLKQQKFSEGVIESVIEVMVKYGYLNDQAYKKGLIEAYKRKGYGKRLIEQKLMLKLKDRTELRELETHSFEEEREAVKRWLKKRGVDLTNLAALTPSERQKHKAFLVRKGFSYEAASEILFDF